MLSALHEVWPQAPLFTAVYNPVTAPWAKDYKVVPSFLNKFPFAMNYHEFYPWLTPMAFESFNFSDFDIVISVTSAEAKGIITKPKTLHLCYCLTPTRYLWSGYEEYFKNKALRFCSQPGVAYLRWWDIIASQRPDSYLAISKNVQKRIKKYYDRDSEVIYPPVDLNKFQISNRKDNFFLIVSRLVPYKRVDIAIEAFNRLKIPLKIIGIGSEEGKLKKLAKSNIEFLGLLTDQELLSYYQNCEAVVFPQEEDFGIVPLEAQACGKPVIAFKGGGALETVIEGKTGAFFYPQASEALEKAILNLKLKFKPEDCRKNAENFGQEIFKTSFEKLVKEEWRKWRKN